MIVLLISLGVPTVSFIVFSQTTDLTGTTEYIGENNVPLIVHKPVTNYNVMIIITPVCKSEKINRFEDPINYVKTFPNQS